MNNPVIKSSVIAAELKCSEGNPRNSEGDFALLNDGSILFAYSRYNGSSNNDDASCDIAAMISYDGGNSFEEIAEPLVKASEHGVINVMSVTLSRLCDGTLCLFYLCKKEPISAYFLHRFDEKTKTFGEAETVIPFTKGAYYVVNNCRVCILPDGRVLVPAARHNIITGADGTGRPTGFAKAEFFIGDKNGRNFKRAFDLVTMPYPAHSGTGLQEPGAVCMANSDIYAYYRTDLGFQYYSIIDKNCTGSSVPEHSRFTSPASPMLIVRNPYSKMYFTFRNPIPNYDGRYEENAPWITAGRTPFVFSQSEEAGEHTPFTVIEDDPSKGFCYPAVFFLNEKEFLISYCFGGKEEGNCLSCTRIRKITLE